MGKKNVKLVKIKIQFSSLNFIVVFVPSTQFYGRHINQGNLFLSFIFMCRLFGMWLRPESKKAQDKGIQRHQWCFEDNDEFFISLFKESKTKVNTFH